MRITLAGGTPAELALPAGSAARGLVLLPDIGGLRPLFDGHCRRLADDRGWAVCAPEPFPGREDVTVAERLATMKSYEPRSYLDAVLAAADHLAGLGATPVGVLGFCMGGMFALFAAGTGRFDKAVSFYGMVHVPGEWAGPQWPDPFEAATSPGACPVLALIGTADPFIPPGDRAELAASTIEVVSYEGADHGFVHDPSRPAHRAAEAADAWERAIHFLSG